VNTYTADDSLAAVIRAWLTSKDKCIADLNKDWPTLQEGRAEEQRMGPLRNLSVKPLRRGSVD